MDRKVILSPRALRDLGEIVRYIAADNPPAAARFGAMLLAETDAIGLKPETGRMVPEFKTPKSGSEWSVPSGSSIAWMPRSIGW